MPKLLFLFLALLLNYITNLETRLNADQEKAIEFQIGSPTVFTKNMNFFKFNYYGSNEAKIIFSYDPPLLFELYLTDPENGRYYLKWDEGNLTYNGTYYLELICISDFYLSCEFGGKLYSTIIGNTETIDLNDNIYYQDFVYSNEYYLGMKKFKVNALKEEKLVYFSISDYFYDIVNYYPFYPGESPPYTPDPHNPDFSNLTIFEIFNVNTQTSERNVRLYKFEPNQEYIIYIHCLKNYNSDYYYNFRYFFFPLTHSRVRTLTGEESTIFPEGPMFGIVNSNIQKDFEIITDMYIKYVKTKEIIENNLQILSHLEFVCPDRYDFYDYFKIQKGETNNTIIFFIPINFENKNKILFIDKIIYESKLSTFTIPAHKSMLIQQKSKYYYDLDYVFTYKSEFKNMRILYSDENEDIDYIIQNYIGFPTLRIGRNGYEGIPIFISKTDRDCTITITQYIPKFARFGVVNSYLFNTLFSYWQKIIKPEMDLDINNYLKLTQMNIRISSSYLPISEFYNVYLNQLDIKINIFIRQIYGGSDLYECDASDYDIHDLQFLTTPISNSKCKNKKSIFNRLYSLDGTKILSGYLDANSYFDIYAEIKDEKNTIINLPQISEYDTRNNAKFLKKDVEYKINFDLNHLIKLDIGFDAEIKITKGQNIKIINSKNPYTEISGEGYTIKSNNDAMVYFIGKLPYTFSQKEIDLEQSKGKIIKISNIFENNRNFVIDLGFKNYCPLSIQHDYYYKIRSDGILYLDNVYEKLKVKLIENEKLFIYSTTEQINRLNIEYIGYNLNNKNNEFNIFLIKKNYEENTIVINSDQVDYIVTDIYFCEPDTTLQLTFLGVGNETKITITNDGSYERKFEIFNGDNKIILETNKPVIFTYSFFDLIDERIFEPDRYGYWDDRSVQNKLTIEEIVDKNNNDNIIKIKFKPNYKQSTTRYIILIVQKNSENTLDNFKDPCFVVDLLNKRPKELKIETIYDIGDNDSVNAEVDLNDILSDNNEYIVTIISQELRFEKKINFYEPKEFSHSEKNSNDDDGRLKGVTLLLVIILPIVGAIIIALVIVFVVRRRKLSSGEIEKVSGLMDKSNE